MNVFRLREFLTCLPGIGAFVRICTKRAYGTPFRVNFFLPLPLMRDSYGT